MRQGPSRRPRVAGESPAGFAARRDGEPATHALVGIARELQTRMLGQLRDDEGFDGLRPSLGPLLSLVWLEARPLSVLAQRLGISRQAVSQLARIAERSGYLARAGEGDDPRAKGIALSPRGRALVDAAIRIIESAQAEFEAQVGAARLRRFAAGCDALQEAFDVQPRFGAEAGRNGHPALGGLPQLAVEIQRRLIAGTSALGHGGLKLSQAQVLPLLAPTGTRARDLALQQRVSRQAISLACLELEALGYLRRTPDPEDRRGAILFRTARGERLLADALEVARSLEASFADVLGREGFERFRETAFALYDPIRDRTANHSSQAKGVRRLALIGTASGVSMDEDRLAERARRLRLELGPPAAARLGELLMAHAQPQRRSTLSRKRTRSPV